MAPIKKKGKSGSKITKMSSAERRKLLASKVVDKDPILVEVEYGGTIPQTDVNFGNRRVGFKYGVLVMLADREEVRELLLDELREAFSHAEKEVNPTVSSSGGSSKKEKGTSLL